MYLRKFNAPIPNQGDQRFNKERLEQVKSLLQSRYKLKQVAEFVGMRPSVLSDYMAYYGLKEADK